nr:PREDICTED: lysosomal alpha-glucosidase-like [Latimeria chalumnae]|eukprot:XP_005999031.1 PREDICTED: lysosomal alpha-glucosidase-like [Latimeria chalumnae]
MFSYQKLPSDKLDPSNSHLDARETKIFLRQGVQRGLSTKCLCISVLLLAFLLSLGTAWFVSEALLESRVGDQHVVQLVPPEQEQLDGQTTPEVCGAVPETHRFNCYPEIYVIVTRSLCESRGCCFIKMPLPPPGKGGVPWCFYPPNFPSYSLDRLNKTGLGFSGELTRKTKTYYPKDIERLELNVTFETNSRLHIKITDSTSPRYEVPIKVPQVTERATDPIYSVEFSKDPFGVIVRRNSNGLVLLNTTVAPLFFTDQFLQISTMLPSQYLYGLGEHQSGFLHNFEWNTLNFWARDIPPMENSNLYGVHPFYLVMEPGGISHGFFLLNSNAMEVALQPAPALTWRTIGGILDFYIFMGPDPSSVISQYLEVIGFPMMPPAWGLGFHLCRWGYGSSNATWHIVKTMRNYGIPQDAQWNDIDYMDGFRDFTFDSKKFATLPQLVKDLHNYGQHYVMILDPGISSTQQPGSYPPYDEGLKRDIFINTTDGKLLIGEVWPGKTAFPDFTNPETHQWWYESLTRLYQQVPFDGLWIMPRLHNNAFMYPLFWSGVKGGSLRVKTICASAKQKESVHYNVHSLYGLMEAKATASALKKLRGKRPFVISRSTFPSQGRYSGHWLGDNRSQWKDLYWSIPGILNFNMFGIPLVGADICGFSGSATEELCVRWMQLGAFYPFSRNHNTQGEQAQDPLAFGPLARSAMKEVLLIRYSLLPYLYTLFHRAHIYGDTVATPLFFQFPEDITTYSIDRQFLWGRSLLVTPVLEAGVDSVIGYFPKGVWYDFYMVLGNKYNVITRWFFFFFSLKTPSTTTWMSSGNPMQLIVALSENATANGDLFWDDGESLDTYETSNYSYMVFNVTQNTLTSTVLHVNVEATFIIVDKVTVFGVKRQPSKVTVNGKEASFSYLPNQVLAVSNLYLKLSDGFSISWI